MLLNRFFLKDKVTQSVSFPSNDYFYQMEYLKEFLKFNKEKFINKKFRMLYIHILEAQEFYLFLLFLDGFKQDNLEWFDYEVTGLDCNPLFLASAMEGKIKEELQNHILFKDYKDSLAIFQNNKSVAVSSQILNYVHFRNAPLYQNDYQQLGRFDLVVLRDFERNFTSQDAYPHLSAIFHLLNINSLVFSDGSLSLPHDHFGLKLIKNKIYSLMTDLSYKSLNPTLSLVSPSTTVETDKNKIKKLGQLMFLDLVEDKTSQEWTSLFKSHFNITYIENNSDVKDEVLRLSREIEFDAWMIIVKDSKFFPKVLLLLKEFLDKHPLTPITLLVMDKLTYISSLIFLTGFKTVESFLIEGHPQDLTHHLQNKIFDFISHFYLRIPKERIQQKEIDSLKIHSSPFKANSQNKYFIHIHFLWTLSHLTLLKYLLLEFPQNFYSIVLTCDDESSKSKDLLNKWFQHHFPTRIIDIGSNSPSLEKAISFISQNKLVNSKLPIPFVSILFPTDQNHEHLVTFYKKLNPSFIFIENEVLKMISFGSLLQTLNSHRIPFQMRDKESIVKEILTAWFQHSFQFEKPVN